MFHCFVWISCYRELKVSVLVFHIMFKALGCADLLFVDYVLSIVIILPYSLQETNVCVCSWWSPKLRCYLDLWVGTSFSVERTASIFRAWRCHENLRYHVCSWSRSAVGLPWPWVPSLRLAFWERFLLHKFSKEESMCLSYWVATSVCMQGNQGTDQKLHLDQWYHGGSPDNVCCVLHKQLCCYWQVSCSKLRHKTVMHATCLFIAQSL
jgi:hypothetical protein